MYYYTQPIVEVNSAENIGLLSLLCKRIKNEPIAIAVKPAPHVRAAAAVIDLIAIANVET